MATYAAETMCMNLSDEVQTRKMEKGVVRTILGLKRSSDGSVGGGLIEW